MALVLGRREAESILIGDDIRITVLEINKGQVKLAFTAPPDVVIMREEVTQRPDYDPDRGNK